MSRFGLSAKSAIGSPHEKECFYFFGVCVVYLKGYAEADFARCVETFNLGIDFCSLTFAVFAWCVLKVAVGRWVCGFGCWCGGNYKQMRAFLQA